MKLLINDIIWLLLYSFNLCGKNCGSGSPVAIGWAGMEIQGKNPTYGNFGSFKIWATKLGRWAAGPIKGPYWAWKLPLAADVGLRKDCSKLPMTCTSSPSNHLINLILDMEIYFIRCWFDILLCSRFIYWSLIFY